MNKVKQQFHDYISTEDFESAEALLSPDIFAVEDQMDELSEEDFKLIEPHWSAVNTGEMISTPIFVLKKIFDHLKFKDDTSIVDLGSGHGVPSLVFGSLNNSLSIKGYDIVKEKVRGATESAERLSLSNISFFEQDLSDEGFEIPPADYYYLFNPVNKEVADLIAAKLLSLSKDYKFKIISVGGRDIKSFKEVGFKAIDELKGLGVEILEA